MDAITILHKMKELAQSNNKEWFTSLVKGLSKEEKEELNKYIDKDNFKSIEWHEYSWYNLYFLMNFREPGIYGTFNQWKNAWKMVKKGSKWFQLLCPIFWDKDKSEIKFFKSIYVFAECDVEIIKEKWEKK